MHGVHVGRVRFPAARMNKMNEGMSRQTALPASGIEGRSDAERMRGERGGVAGTYERSELVTCDRFPAAQL